MCNIDPQANSARHASRSRVVARKTPSTIALEEKVNPSEVIPDAPTEPALRDAGKVFDAIEAGIEDAWRAAENVTHPSYNDVQQIKVALQSLTRAIATLFHDATGRVTTPIAKDP